MNCKPGDIARIVSGHIRHECVGMVVEVLCSNGNNGWYVRNAAIERLAKQLGFEPCIKDIYLRPIRDQDGEDEILRIAGKPRKETVK